MEPTGLVELLDELVELLLGLFELGVMLLLALMLPISLFISLKSK